MSDYLDELAKHGKLRCLRTVQSCGREAIWEGRSYLNFSGNDYLGIAGDEQLRRDFYLKAAQADLPLSAASSRLLTGNSPEYGKLEQALLKFHHAEERAALVFNSGYHANIGILPALAGKGDWIFADKLVHASIIDGLKLAGANYLRYRHLDYADLESKLAGAPSEGKKFIVTESVFSMDGDLINPGKLVELKQKYNAILIVDEAHGVGIFGPGGTGVMAENKLDGDTNILIGTFGKAFGSLGAYAIMERETREILINRMRSLIFTTGIPPVNLAWSCQVLEEVGSVRWDDKRCALLENAAYLREEIARQGFTTLGDSQIVPLIVGEEHEAVALAEFLQKRGMLVFAIRPPTVPEGSSRLRFSLSAAHSRSDIDELIGALTEWK